MNNSLSIITINYNNALGLEKTIRSVITELENNIEYIIIDGGSIDNSLKIIEANKANLNYWVSEPDGGIYDAMNKGVSIAKNEWILFMNSGDLLVSGAIKKVFEEDLDAFDLVYGQNYSASAGSVGKLVVKNWKWTLLSFMNGCIPHQSTLTRRSILTQIPFRNEYKLASCRIFYIETIIDKKIQYKYLPIPISIYDVDGLSTTKKPLLLQELDDYLLIKYGPELFKDLKELQRLKLLIEGRSTFELLTYSSGKPRLKKLIDGFSNLILKIIKTCRI